MTTASSIGPVPMVRVGTETPLRRKKPLKKQGFKMKTFKEYITEKDYSNDYEEISIEILNNGEELGRVKVNLSLYDSEIEDSGADYGEDDDYVWDYDWEIDSKSKKLAKKFKLDKYIGLLLKGKLTAGLFKTHEGEDYGWIDVGEDDYARY